MQCVKFQRIQNNVCSSPRQTYSRCGSLQLCTEVAIIKLIVRLDMRRIAHGRERCLNIYLRHAIHVDSKCWLLFYATRERGSFPRPVYSILNKDKKNTWLSQRVAMTIQIVLLNKYIQEIFHWTFPMICKLVINFMHFTLLELQYIQFFNSMN